VFDALVAVLVGGSHGQKGRESDKSLQECDKKIFLWLYTNLVFFH
jgi:hypothetical protein